MDIGDGGYDGHIPFRGEEQPKKRGHHSHPDSNEKKRALIFWLLVVLFCIIFIYFVFASTKVSEVVTSVGSIIFVLMTVWAVQDAKRIKKKSHPIKLKNVKNQNQSNGKK